jgi:hypothetical protein
MRYFLILLLLLLSLTIHAQDGAWPVVENCLGELPYPTIPHANWDFEGVIFSHNQQGVRAIRTDVETSYFIAFEDGENFPAVGGFSPDGRWFAYPSGERWDGIRMDGGGSSWLINGFSLVSTDPRNLRTEIAFPEDVEGTFVSGELYDGGITNVLYQIIWLSNEEFVYFGASRMPIHEIDAPLVFNINSSQYIPNLNLDETLIQVADTHVDTIWLADGSYISTESPSVLARYAVEGEIAELVMQGYITAISLSPDAQSLAFFNNKRLHIANLESHSIEGLCLEAQGRAEYFFPEILWSPDGNYLAFLYDGYPILLNLGTREMQILRYQTGSLMGWYPIAED